MLITADGELRILNGRTQLNSAFYAKRKRTRINAHRNLVNAMHERGWLSNGKKRLNIKDIDTTPRPGESPARMYGKLLGAIQDLTSAWNDKEPEPDRPFWQHEVTGQIIYVDQLMAATKLWPLYEVLELVDSTNP